MPREISDFTLTILIWLWYMPWASAADIARVISVSTNETVKPNKVNMALERWVTNGLLLRKKLGRVRDAVWRYVFSSDGVDEMRNRWGCDAHWWHTAAGVDALSRRLEFLEMAYAYLPHLWRSNLVAHPRCSVYQDWWERAWQNDEPVQRSELITKDWSHGRLVGLEWFDAGPFNLIATYGDGAKGDHKLHVPVLFRGRFLQGNEFVSLRRDMDGVLVQDQRWLKIPQEQALSPDFCPCLVTLCSNRVSAVMMHQKWQNSLTKYNGTNPAIIDAQGQVVRPMEPPTSLWRDYRPPPAVEDVGNITAVVESLGSGPYAAVNGRVAWSLYEAVVDSPGAYADQVLSLVMRDSGRIRPLPKAKKRKKAKQRDKKNPKKTSMENPNNEELGTSPAAILERMKTENVVTLLNRSSYLFLEGMDLLVGSQRTPRRRVNQRYGIFLKKDGTYRRREHIHAVKLAEAILYLRRHGFAALPVLGIIIEYWHNNERYRVTPDAFIILPTGVLVAVEFERSATKKDDLEEKANKYAKLQEIGHPIPVLFITETEEAAILLAELGYEYVLAASLDAVGKGPHGRARFRDGADRGTPGCWWSKCVKGMGIRSDAPIDLWAKIYVDRHPKGEWRVPVSRPFNW